MFKIIISRDYQTYRIIDKLGNEINTRIDCLDKKLFSGDTLDSEFNMVNSLARNSIIPGLIILTKPYQYDKGRIWYKCIPFNKEYPIFLISKRIKPNTTFVKLQENQYIIIKFDHWNDKHPRGKIIDTIGNCNKENTLRYFLLGREIYYKFPKFIINKQFISEFPVKHDINIFSIDPPGCKDFDDAISIQRQKNQTIISTYISNIAYYLNYYNLWNKLTNQVATIYTSTKNYNMLDSKLSLDLFSLRELLPRISLCTDFIIKNNKIIDVNIYPVQITIQKNYHYEEPDLLKCKEYIQMKSILEDVEKPMPFIIKDSHDVVELLMILTNYHNAKQLFSQKMGIYREVNQSSNQELNTILLHYHSKYSLFNKTIPMKHDGLGLDLYCHITSPIRRLVDIINQLEIMQTFITISQDGKDFLTKWINKIDYINDKHKLIQKTQNYFILLDAIEKQPEKIYEAIVVKKLEKKTTIYIQELNTLFDIKEIVSEKESDKIKVKAYSFWKEHYEKIRMMKI